MRSAAATDVLAGAPRRSASWRIAAAAAAVVALSIAQSALTPFHVVGASMQPYTEDGDLLIANRSMTPQRGDIVVLAAPATWAGEESGDPERIVKRVIGVAGDRISCCDGAGAIVRNGEPLTETYLAPGTAASSIAFDVVVPPGHIWVLGDNRAVSRDSRLGVASAPHGAIPVSDVIAVVWGRVG